MSDAQLFVDGAAKQMRRIAGRVRPIRHVSVWIYTGLLLFILLACFFAPLPYDPLKPGVGEPLKAPNAHNWFGTDTIGRDIFSRTVAAGRLDLPLALGGTALALVLGVAIGLFVSTKNKWSERVMRGVDAFQAFPLLVLAMALVALAGNRFSMVVFAIALIFAPTFIRLVR